jgi:hypothetical protein
MDAELRRSGWRRSALIVLASMLGGTAAMAGEPSSAREPIVLNGRLELSSFDGGVGYNAADGGYYSQGTVIVIGGSAGAFAGTSAFAAARASAFAASRASAGHGGHGFGGHGMGGHGMGGHGMGGHY